MGGKQIYLYIITYKPFITMKKKTIYNFGSFNHKQLEEYVLKNPTLIHKDFKPIQSELIILRGTVDILGKIQDQYCLVEIKIDKICGLKSHARNQLIRYSKAINTYFQWFDKQTINFTYCIIRNNHNNIYIDYYNNLTELEGEKYSSGIGYYNGNQTKHKKQHLSKSKESKQNNENKKL